MSWVQVLVLVGAVGAIGWCMADLLEQILAELKNLRQFLKDSR